MTNQDWSNLGNDIRNLVQSAIDSQDFQKLNETISRTINQAVEGVSQGLSYAEEKLNEGNRKGKYRNVSPKQGMREKKKQGMNQMVPVSEHSRNDGRGDCALRKRGYTGRGAWYCGSDSALGRDFGGISRASESGGGVPAFCACRRHCRRNGNTNDKAGETFPGLHREFQEQKLLLAQGTGSVSGKIRGLCTPRYTEYAAERNVPAGTFG